MNRDVSLRSEGGATLVELMISLVVLAVVVMSAFGLFVSLVNSTLVARNKSVATTLATNQMEYLKGLPYDSLAVAGGSIYSPTPLPSTSTQKLNGTTYIVKTSINYVDDAYDGCTNYPTQTLKELYCRNYPSPSGAPSVDSNPGDYKVVHVSVTNTSGDVFAEVDTQVAARVAETSSTTGALLVTVIDDNGNPVSGSTVGVVNNTISPAVNLSDSTDSNGVAIFYGLRPDSGKDYVITASKTGYSTLATIAAAGSLQPTYPHQSIVAQQSSSVTLTIKPQGAPSMLVEAVDTAGNPIAGLRIYAKGGYKRYTSPTDTSYYFDNASPDSRPTTNASGLATLSNLVPGSYYFCGDAGATSCVVGGTAYYLVAALPYGGNNSFYPVAVPSYEAANPPTTTYEHSGTGYLQKVRLVLSTNAGFPRVQALSPSSITLSSTALDAFSFQVTGANLSAATVRFMQGSSTYVATCSGSATVRNCTVNLTGISSGFLQTVVSVGGNTLTTPVAPPLGGISVSP